MRRRFLPSGRGEAALVSVWLAGLWGWLFWSCAVEWQKESFQFGWLVPPLVLYFLLLRLEAVSRTEAVEGAGISDSRSRIVWLAALLIGGLAIGPLEIVRLTPLPWVGISWAMYVVVAALTFVTAHLMLAPKVRGAVIFPVLFAALALPWPTGLEQFFTHDLANFMAAACAEVLQWLGVPAIASGKTVDLGDGCIVGIEEACSGLRSLQSALILALGLGELYRLNSGARWLLAIGGLGVALIENFLRLLILSSLGSKGGSALVARWHDTAGMGGLVILAVSLFLIAKLFPSHSRPIPHGGISPGIFTARHPAAAFFSALILSIAGFLLAHAWYGFWPVDQGAGEPKIIARSEIHPVPVPPGVLAELQPTSGGYYACYLSGGGFIQGYHFFWTPSRNNLAQFFHRPDACMPGVGWKLLGPPRQLVLQIDGRKETWWNFSFERGGVRVNMVWTVLLAGETFSYPFDSAGGLRLEGSFLVDMVRRRLSRPSYEVAAVMISPAGETLTLDEAQRAVTLFFALSDEKRKVLPGI